MKNNPDWRAFASQLTSLANAEGEQNFFDSAFQFLKTHLTVDSCAVFKVSKDRQTGAEHLATFGVLNPAIANLLANDYVEHGFIKDPMVKTALIATDVRVRQLPASQYTDAYRSQYFDKAGLIDKITSIHTTRQALYLVSFYRLKSSGPFEQRDFKDLEILAPIIGRFVLRHLRLTQDKSNFGKDQLSTHISTLVHDKTQIFSELSKREKQICIQLLQGYEEKSIAENLGVKLASVTTYRRRLYNKLSINNKSELFQLALMSSR